MWKVLGCVTPCGRVYFKIMKRRMKESGVCQVSEAHTSDIDVGDDREQKRKDSDKNNDRTMQKV